MGFWIVMGAALALGALLAIRPGRIPTTATGIVLLLCVASVFGVRLTHEGPYPFPGGFDLFVVLACLLAGLVLVRSGPSGSGRGIRACLFLAPFLLLGGLVATLHEAGEVMILRTWDDAGGVHETRLWVLDWRGSTWHGSGAERRWFQRLSAHPRVELVRGGVARCHVAVVVEDRDTAREVRRRIEQKHLFGRLLAGLGIHLFVRPDDAPDAAIAVRFDPCPEDARPEGPPQKLSRRTGA